MFGLYCCLLCDMKFWCVLTILVVFAFSHLISLPTVSRRNSFEACAMKILVYPVIKNVLLYAKIAP